MYRPAAHIQDDELYLPAGQLGMGWWGDAWDEVKSVAKKVQANPDVRGLDGLDAVFRTSSAAQADSERLL